MSQYQSPPSCQAACVPTLSSPAQPSLAHAQLKVGSRSEFRVQYWHWPYVGASSAVHFALNVLRLKVKHSLYGHWGFQEVEAPRFQDSRHMKVVRLSALRTCRLYPPENIPGTHFCWRLSQLQGHSAAGRIMSMKSFNDTIGNRTGNFPLVVQCLNQLRHLVTNNHITLGSDSAFYTPALIWKPPALEWLFVWTDAYKYWVRIFSLLVSVPTACIEPHLTLWHTESFFDAASSTESDARPCVSIMTLPYFILNMLPIFQPR